MTLEAQVAALTEATTDLLEAVNVGKATLDEAVADAEASAATAATAVAAHVALPDPHTQYAKESDLGTAASKNVPASGNASANQVVLGSDTRLRPELSSGEWVKLPAVYKLSLGGQGAVTIDTRTKDGVVTESVQTFNVNGNLEEFVYFENAYEIKAAATNTASVEIL